MKSHLVLIYFTCPLTQDNLAINLESHLRYLKQKGSILFPTAVSAECFQQSLFKLDRTLFYNIDEYLPLTNLLDASWGFDSIYLVEETAFRLMHEDAIDSFGLEQEISHNSKVQHAA